MRSLEVCYKPWNWPLKRTRIGNSNWYGRSRDRLNPDFPLYYKSWRPDNEAEQTLNEIFILNDLRYILFKYSFDTFSEERFDGRQIQNLIEAYMDVSLRLFLSTFKHCKGYLFAIVVKNISKLVSVEFFEVMSYYITYMLSVHTLYPSSRADSESWIDPSVPVSSPCRLSSTWLPRSFWSSTLSLSREKS